MQKREQSVRAARARLARYRPADLDRRGKRAYRWQISRYHPDKVHHWTACDRATAAFECSSAASRGERDVHVVSLDAMTWKACLRPEAPPIAHLILAPVRDSRT